VYKELADLVSSSDALYLTLAQNEDTQNLITDAMLESMKKETIFVSVVHKIYNEDLIIPA
jgi:lactate dehydrogenase-like 2-hydroxyacid dehydrogenase